jgi:peptidoglycan/xylan/chitin deacetylase (PgdA/CDA1 family)
MITELAKVETAMIKILGVKPKYFRPPHGAYNDLVLKVLSERGYTKLLLWTDDTRTSGIGSPRFPIIPQIRGISR